MKNTRDTQSQALYAAGKAAAQRHARREEADTGSGDGVQHEFWEMANDSPRVTQLKSLQAAADKHTASLYGAGYHTNHTGLPDTLKAGVESLSGFSMDDVKVHYNSPKPATIQAHAYAQGTQIHLGPGQERHLPHEAWHVVQQKQGRVTPTLQMKGGTPVNDNRGLEKEADIMGTKAMMQPFSASTFVQPKRISAARSPIQRLVDQEREEFLESVRLIMKMNGEEGQFAEYLIEKAETIAATAPTIAEARTRMDPFLEEVQQSKHILWKDAELQKTGGSVAQSLLTEIARLFTLPAIAAPQIRRYPMLQDEILEEYTKRLTPDKILDWVDTKTIYEFVTAEEDKKDEAVTHVVESLRKTVSISEIRANKYGADDDAPYNQMTDEGLLWSHPEFAQNTARVGKTGKAYFEDLSGQNMEQMRGEVDQNNLLTSNDWFNGFLAEATGALSEAVVNHYTTSFRAQAMVESGMKSKTLLEKYSTDVKHNTSPYDDHGLANSGFLFFFIEPKGAPLRATRFAQGDPGAKPARISLPITTSGLLTKGWLMLSDFAQREYPDVMTDKSNKKHTSWLPTRKQQEQPSKPEFTEPVRHFNVGMGEITGPEMMHNMETHGADKAAALSVVTPQVRGDKDSHQTYTGPEGSIKIKDSLLNNILVGADIIPGLALRAALEVARISAVNRTLGAQLQKLKGAPLLLFMLKDLTRPQAMIPNQLHIKPKDIETAP